MKTLTTLGAACLLAAGCVAMSACGSIQVGRDFDVAAFATQAQRNVTTRADVRRWLGAPEAIGTMLDVSGNRYEQWAYYSGSGELGGGRSTRLKLLEVQFDERGILKGYNWASTPGAPGVSVIEKSEQKTQ